MDFSTEELNAFVESLETKRESILRGLSIETLESKPVSLDEPIGRLTRVDAIQRMNMADATKGRLRNNLAQIDAALQRIKDGSYGECAMCGERIAKARLIHAPEAAFCLDCQTAGERS